MPERRKFMKLSDLLNILSTTDRIRIIKGIPGNHREPQFDPNSKVMFCGWVGMMDHMKDEAREFIQNNPKVVRLQCCQEIRHREYAKRSLLPPYEPEITRQYEFSDLTTFIYYDIYAK